MASVTLDRVSKSYGKGRREVVALRELSLTVADGEYLVLVGPSGCGKTTTLRLIAGLEERSWGTIRIGDRVVDDLQPKDRDVAMVFQNYALYPHMTVYKNLAFGLKMRRVPRGQIDQRVREVAAMLGVGDLLDRKPWQLSGGQKQRVALGRAVVRRPDAFLFDEPLSNLDAQFRVQTRSELKELQRRIGATVIHVTHDQEEAMTLGDRIAVLRDGLLQQCGPPLEVYRRPANRFVAGFIGTPGMNFLDGRLSPADGAVWFDCRLGRLRLADDTASRLRSREAAPLVLGVRPEAVRVARDGEAPASEGMAGEAGSDGVVMKLHHTEPAGDRVYLFLDHPGTGTRLVSTAAGGGTTPSDGDKVRVAFDPMGVHAFEPGEPGKSLLA